MAEASLEDIRFTIRELGIAQTFNLNAVVTDAVGAVAHASAMPPAKVPVDLWVACDAIVNGYKEIKEAAMIIRLFLLEVDPPKKRGPLAIEAGPSKLAIEAGPSKEEGSPEDMGESKDTDQAKTEIQEKAESKPEGQSKE